jgi:hypothetical protein
MARKREKRIKRELKHLGTSESHSGWATRQASRRAGTRKLTARAIKRKASGAAVAQRIGF